MKISYIFPLAFTFFLTSFSTVLADVRQDVSDLMEHVRKSEVVDNAALNAAPAMQVLNELKFFYKDGNESVVIEAISQTLNIGIRNSSNAKVRQIVTQNLIKVATTNSQPSTARYIAHIFVASPLQFGESDFTPEMKSEIVKLLEKHPDVETILLAGTADAQQATDFLQQIVESKKDSESLSWWAQSSWAAHLALARLGVKEELDYVLNRFRDYSKSDVIKVTKLLENLAYTRQPEAIQIVVTHLFSSKSIPSIEPEIYPRTPYNQYALEYLSPAIEGFPIKTKGLGYSQSEIETARAWLKANKGKWKIKR